jgi:hypothetical protein
MRNRFESSERKRGTALLAALFAAFVAASMVMVLMTITNAKNEQTDVERYSKVASFSAEGAIEAAKKELQVSIANWRPVQPEGDVLLNGRTVEYTVTPTGLNAISTDGAGIQTLVTGYELKAVGREQRSTALAHRIVNAEATPIFQFAVFYSGDLEIFPGPSMTLGGRVHSNADIYLGCGGTLTVDTNYLHSVGDIFRERKDSPGVSAGTVQVRKWVENPYDPSEPEEYVTMYSDGQMSNLGVSTLSGYDSNFTEGLDLNGDGDFYDADEWLPWGPGALEFWGAPEGYAGGSGHTVLSGDHDVSEAVVPDVGSIAMFEPSIGGDYVLDATSGEYVEATGSEGTHSKGFFHEQAGLTILVSEDGSWDAFDEAGTSVKASLAGVVSITQLYDARQANGSGQDTPVLEIDLEQLNASGQFPGNGLLYAAHYGMGEGTDARGVVVKNGAELLAPLSVVTEGALYVQGDYNTVAKKGAAVMADAVSLLSNSWDGSKNPGQLPYASDTTFNVAIVTGNHETGVGHYNGGLENLPRFHENWSGKNCNIVGSFVNTWTSRYATGAWSYGGDRYKAPRRNWSYDSAFNDVANLPPFTPMAVSARDIVAW